MKGQILRDVGQNMVNYINKLKSVFGSTKRKEESEPTWIEREGNRFGVRILDCRPVVMNTTAWTSDKEIAESFNRLRASDGTEYLGKMPDDGVRGRDESAVSIQW